MALSSSSHHTTTLENPHECFVDKDTDIASISFMQWMLPIAPSIVFHSTIGVYPVWLANWPHLQANSPMQSADMKLEIQGPLQPPNHTPIEKECVLLLPCKLCKIPIVLQVVCWLSPFNLPHEFCRVSLPTLCSLPSLGHLLVDSIGLTSGVKFELGC